MIEIKLQCYCGQKYAFEIEPVNGQMGTTVACPACGADGTTTANQVIAQALAAQPQEAPPSEPGSSATVVAPAEIANPVPPAPQAPVASPTYAAPPVAAAPVARMPQPHGLPARPPVGPTQRPGVVPGNRAGAPVPAPVPAAPKGKLTKGQLTRIIILTASAIIGSVVAQAVVRHGFFGIGMSSELKKGLAAAEGTVNAMAPMMLNPFTRLDGATVGPGKKFTYKYTLLKQKAAEVDVSKWRQSVVPMLKKDVRASKAMLPLFQQGVTVCYRYHGKDGVLIDEIAIDPSDVLGK